MVVEQVGFVDDEHRIASTFGVFGGQGLGGLRGQGGFVVGGGVSERADDVVSTPRTPSPTAANWRTPGASSTDASINSPTQR